MKKGFLVLFMAFLLHSQEDIPLSILQDLNTQELRDQLSNINQESNEVEIEDSLEQVNDADEKEGNINDRFGFSFFDIKPKTTTPVLDIPLQSDYILSFNDELELLLLFCTPINFSLAMAFTTLGAGDAPSICKYIFFFSSSEAPLGILLCALYLTSEANCDACFSASEAPAACPLFSS